MLGPPAHVTACLFDLDGALTPTAAIHDAAWRQTFDGYLREHGADAVVRDLGEPVDS